MWIITAWQRISPEVTVRGFKVLYIQRNGWKWWYVVDWQWSGKEC